MNPQAGVTATPHRRARPGAPIPAAVPGPSLILVLLLLLVLTLVLLSACRRSGGEAAAPRVDSIAAPAAASAPSSPGASAAPAAPATSAAPAKAVPVVHAASCSALHSGRYRLLMPMADRPLAEQTSVVTLDADTLSVTSADRPIQHWTARGPCRFSADDDTASDIVVTAAGVVLARTSRDRGASHHLFIAFPEQVHAVAELAGDWNAIGMTPSAASHTAVTGSAMLDAAGRLSAVTNCGDDRTWSVDACEDIDAHLTGQLGALRTDRAGGFDQSDAFTGASTTRVFAYRADNGAQMMALISRVGFALWSRRTSLPLPTTGSRIASWNLDMKPDLTSSGELYETVNTVTAVDAATARWTRSHVTVGSPRWRVETMHADQPRPGYIHRAAGTSTDGGRSTTISEFTTMPLQGMGMSAGILPALRVFELTADAP